MVNLNTLTPLWDRYVDIEHGIILAVAELFNDPERLEQWTAYPLLAEVELRAELDKIVARHWNKTARLDLKEAFESTAKTTLESDERTYRLALDRGALTKEPMPIAESLTLQRILEGGFLATERALATAGTIARASTIARLNQAVLAVAGGEATIDQAIKAAAQELADEGIAGFIYPGSRSHIGLPEYVRRELVTGVMNTTRAMSWERAAEWGSDLIQISSHAGARPGCFPYQGRVFSLSGEHEKYPSLKDTTYGEPAGIFGINCRHYSWPWFEGLNDEYTEAEKDPAKSALGLDNDELYELSQEQRYNERQIRRWKRRAEFAEGIDLDSSKARAKVKEWQKRQRDFLKATGLFNRDYRREAA